MSPIGELDELLLYVTDMDRMVRFYTAVLGFEIEEGAPEHGFVRLDTGAASLGLHAGRDGGVGDFTPKPVFRVPDVKAAQSYLREHDIELGDIRSPEPGTDVCDCVDPDGNTFSIESRGTR